MWSGVFGSVGGCVWEERNVGAVCGVVRCGVQCGVLCGVLCTGVWLVCGGVRWCGMVRVCKRTAMWMRVCGGGESVRAWVLEGVEGVRVRGKVWGVGWVYWWRVCVCV